MNWYVEALKKFAVFNGRARRTEYWMFFLVNAVITILIGFLEVFFKMPKILSTVYSLAIILPGIAVASRRLHDTGRSGWWQLILLLPIVGPIVLIVFWAQDSQPGDNQYGPNPKTAV